MLPLSVQAKPVRSTQISGELEIVYEDSHSDRQQRLEYLLHSGGKTFRLRFKGEPPRDLRSGMRMNARGYRKGDTLELNAGEASFETGVAAAASSSMGQHRVLVVMVNFQDKQTQPFTAQQAQSVMFGTTSDFFREASYGQTWLTGDVYGWFTIPVSYTSCDTSAIATYAQQAAVSAGANLSNYDHLVYTFPQNACTWQGRGSVGGTPSQAWVNEWFEIGIVGHELGHNFGLYHSRSMDCGAASIGTNCTSDEYGDTMDLMGAANSAHFNLFQKERLGWINSGTAPPLTTVTTSGNYWVDSYESANLNSKGLKVLKSTDPVTGAKTWYYIERRTASGFDSFLSGNTNVLNGVIVRTGSDSGGQNTYLLDMTPATQSWYDPALTSGQSFTDAAAGVTISILSADSMGALVSVSVTQPCFRVNPTVTLLPAQSPWLRSGATASYDISLTNNDSVGCGPSTFNLGAAAASGWTSVFAPSSVTLGPGSTGAAVLQLTSPVGTADGFYAVNVSAANSSNPLYASSKSLTYSLVSALGMTTTSQGSYTRNQTATVKTTVNVGGTPLSGVVVTFTMTKSNGTVVTGTGTTGANGVASFSYAFNRKKDPTGIYQVLAQGTMNGVTGSKSVSFAVK